MHDQERRTSVGSLPTPTSDESRVPTVLTRLVWLALAASAVVFGLRLRSGGPWTFGPVAIDGLTAVLWVAIAFLSGVVHSYSRRYMAGSRRVDRFFGRLSAFTLVAMCLVAADHVVLFWAAWLAMGLLMADLIGHVEGWNGARTAASLARRYFLASSASLGVGLVTLRWATGATTVSGIAAAVDAAPTAAVLLAAGAVLLAAMMQSALLPFHTWLLSSMTAPTPASALMHAGFVNAGGILLVRFAPVVTVNPGTMLAITAVGAASALLGKLLKTVQTDVKGRLGCSTVGQMGFMIMQAGLGFFAAAITHLVLHGFYKAYQFLSSGGRVARERPTKHAAGSTGPAGAAVVLGTGLAGGALFAALTGKGTALDGGLLLTLLVTLTVLQAARTVVTDAAVPPAVRYAAVPLVTVPALAVYAVLYRAIEGLLTGLPAVGDPMALPPIHGVLAAAFVAAYLAVETGVYRHSERLYVALVNASRPASDTLLTSPEEYNEY